MIVRLLSITTFIMQINKVYFVMYLKYIDCKNLISFKVKLFSNFVIFDNYFIVVNFNHYSSYSSYLFTFL